MTELVEISGCSNPNRKIDVVFVHGLDGNARSTWQSNDKTDGFWPAWLGKDYPDIGVWSLDYDAKSLVWKGHAMPLVDRAKNVLDYLELHGFGQRPIGFVCHSLGGLVVKQALRHAKEFGNKNWKPIVEQTRFIEFLATPHSGADIANWIKHLSTLLRPTDVIDDLQAHNPTLRDLNDWFRDNYEALGITTAVYCEELETKGIMVVNKTTANPCIPGVHPISLDVDHITICKPESDAGAVYLRLKQLIDTALTALSAVDSPLKPGQSSKPSIKPNNATMTKSYSGQAKLNFCRNLGQDWKSLADILEIEASDQNKFDKGDEGRGIWDWLERRRELGKLPDALDTIKRSDLAKDLRLNP